jgi:hypothetical protein
MAVSCPSGKVSFLPEDHEQAVFRSHPFDRQAGALQHRMGRYACTYVGCGAGGTGNLLERSLKALAKQPTNSVGGLF